MIARIINQAAAWYLRFMQWRQRRYFLSNARRYPYAQPEFGITVVGTLETRGSLSKVLRDLVRSLKDAGIPYQTYSTSVRRRIQDGEVFGLLTPRKLFRAGRYRCVLEMFDSPFPAEELGMKRATVAFWEFTSGLLETHSNLRDKPLLVGMSDFNAEYYRTVTGKGQSAAKLLYPFRRPPLNLPSCEMTREKFGLGLEDFVVFFNFDYGSSVGRKNPEGALLSFSEAFAGQRQVKLVFKTQNAATHPLAVQKVLDLVHELNLEDQFVAIDSYISEIDVYALTKACDVYLSLHRGEGFGLGIAEAMSFGKAVVVTNYSSTTEFCTFRNSMLVDCSLVPLREDQRAEHPFLKNVSAWAEPDVHVAANALRRLYDDPELRRRIGAAAKDFIENHFSLPNFKKSVERLLQD